MRWFRRVAVFLLLVAGEDRKGATVLARDVSEPTRLAVLCDPFPQVRALADLLEVHIGKNWGVEVLSRGELPALLDEKALSLHCAEALRGSVYLQADGLLVLSVVTAGNEKALATRLVARKKGIVLGVTHFPLSLDDPDAYLRHVDDCLRVLVGKLGVSDDLATFVSSLNLYSPLETVEYRSVARQLSLLINRRLARERSIFLLERWRLRDVMTEGLFGSQGHSELEAGHYVLSGNIEMGGDKSKAIVEVTLRLRGAADRDLRVSGKGASTGLDDLADRLVMEIVGMMGKDKDSLVLDRVAEAEAYFHEARWAYHAGRYEEACHAAESSYALGYTNPILHEVRTRAYSCLAFPDPQWPIEFPNSNRVVNVEESDLHLESAIAALESLQTDYVRGDTRSEATDWRILSAHVIGNASKVLMAYYAVKPTGATARRLAYLRKMIRASVGELIDQRESVSHLYGVFSLLPLYTPYWYETPEETIAAYQRLLAQRFIEQEHVDKDIRYCLVRRWGIPYLLDWSGKRSVAELDRLWEPYVCDLVESSDVRSRLDGLWYRIHDPKRQDQRRDNIQALNDLLWESRELIFFGERPRINPDCPWMAVFRQQEKRALEERLLYYAFQESAKRNEELSMRVYGLLNPFIASDTGRERVRAVYEEYCAYRRQISPALMEKQKASFSSYEDIFFRQYPELAGAGEATGVVVSAFTRPVAGSDGAREPRYAQAGFCVTRDEVWATAQIDSRRAMVAVNDNSGATNVLFLPQGVGSYLGYMNNGNHVELFGVNERFVVIVDDSKQVFAYDRGRRQWAKVDVPKFWYTSLLVSGEVLFLGFSPSAGKKGEVAECTSSGILTTDLQRGGMTILSSSSRSPAQSPLDSIEPYRVVFVGGAGGDVLVWASPSASPWKYVPSEGGKARVCLYRSGGAWERVADYSRVPGSDEEGFVLLGVSRKGTGEEEPKKQWIATASVLRSQPDQVNPAFELDHRFVAIPPIQMPLVDAERGVCLALRDAGRYKFTLHAISLRAVREVVSMPFAVRRLEPGLEARIMLERGFEQSFYIYCSPNLYATGRRYVVSSLCANGFWHVGKDELPVAW